jgi:hypothetical protein
MTGDCLVVFNSANATGRLWSLRARKQHACRQFRPPVSRLYSLGELILALWRLKPEEDSSRTLPHPLARHRALVGKTGLPCGSGALLDRVQSTVVPSDRGKFALTQTPHSASVFFLEPAPSSLRKSDCHGHGTGAASGGHQPRRLRRSLRTIALLCSVSFAA